MTCCIFPRGSVKRRSTYLMSLSLMFFRTSEALLIFPSSLIDVMSWSDDMKAGGRGRQDLSDRVEPAFAGADADRLLDCGDEDLAVADAAGLRRIADRFDRAVDELVRQHDLDLHLGQEVDDVFGAAIEFGVAFLAAESLGLGDGDALQPNLLQRLLHLVELEWFDDASIFFILALPPPGGHAFVRSTKHAKTFGE